ncbi:hypothetical protein BH09PSE5_BH09PSE5_24650 [soil metagenome]
MKHAIGNQRDVWQGKAHGENEDAPSPFFWWIRLLLVASVTVVTFPVVFAVVVGVMG